MINQGWIKLHRKLIDHWLFNEKTKKTKLEAWLIILLESNHSDAKVLINGSLIECKRGQSVKSVGTWAKQFRWSNAKVNTFFKILEKDGMIEREGLSKTTRLTICNYESYQGKEITEKKQNTNRKETNLYKQECKEEIKNDKEKYTDLEFIDRWKKARMRYFKKPYFKTKLEFNDKKKLEVISKTYTKIQIDNAIKGLFTQKGVLEHLLLQPSHFLELKNFEMYLTCSVTGEQVYEKQGFKKPIDRI